jgi:hypothetical protein
VYEQPRRGRRVRFQFFSRECVAGNSVAVCLSVPVSVSLLWHESARCIYIYIYIYTYKERERERERDMDGHCYILVADKVSTFVEMRR